jgi:hypothetical protein
MERYFHKAKSKPPRIRLSLAPKDRPVSFELPRDKSLPVLIMVLVSIWGAVGIVGNFLLIAPMTEKAHGAALLVPYGLAALVTIVIVGLGWLALRLYVREDIVTIGEDEIIHRSPRLWGENVWREPLANYRGLRASALEIDIGAKKLTYQLVELVHESDEEKTIPVFIERGTSLPQHLLRQMQSELGKEFVG